MTKERRSTQRLGEITEEQIRNAAIRVLKEWQTVDEAMFTEGEAMRERVRDFLIKTARSEKSSVSVKSTDEEVNELRERRSVQRLGNITDEQVRSAAIRVLGDWQTVDEAMFTEGEAMRERIRDFLIGISDKNT